MSSSAAKPLKSHGTAQNFPEAIECFQRGAKLGDGIAIYYLGWLTQEGKVIPQDFALAVQLLVEAGKLGCKTALITLREWADQSLNPYAKEALREIGDNKI